jgi:hypothetical protein
MFNRRLALALVVILSLVFSGVAMAANQASTPVSDMGVPPYIIDDLYTTPPNPGSGNRTCEDVGLAFFNDASYYLYSSKANYVDGVFYPDPVGGVFPPDGFTVTTDGTYVSWSGNHAGLAMIVKGGPDANVYVYDESLNTFYTSDSGLASPPNASGSPAGLSNLTFCWNPAPPVCTYDTAWSAGPRYTNRGNWATYTPYTGVANTVTLFAGQTMNAGTVSFSAPDMDGNVTITIAFNAGWGLHAGVLDAVKIQGYDSAPSGNPAPGLFTTYKGNELTVTVPQYAFYGVHVDVQYCPE